MAASREGPNGVPYEDVYQPWLVNVGANTKFEKFGFVLIGISTFVMIFQGLGVGPPWVWKRADDVTTVLFTGELLMRVVEKGYLFFTEDEKNWNFFDTLVVTNSVVSMVIAIRAEQAAAASQGQGKKGGDSMSKLKVLRTLRLLRLLRLMRFFKGIEKVNQGVDVFLTSLGWVFIGLIVVVSAFALMATVLVAVTTNAQAWLRIHQLPSMPKID